MISIICYLKSTFPKGLHVLLSKRDDVSYMCLMFGVFGFVLLSQIVLIHGSVFGWKLVCICLISNVTTVIMVLISLKAHISWIMSLFAMICN